LSALGRVLERFAGGEFVGDRWDSVGAVAHLLPTEQLLYRVSIRDTDIWNRHDPLGCIAMSYKARPFSARWDADVLERLERRSEQAGTSRSRLAERYVDEGTRMDEHPGILFRSGPTGRRAALAGGPDVWELMQTVKSGRARGDTAVTATADLLDLTESQVRIAVRYYAAYPDEIDERIKRNVEEADAAEAAWKREQAALA